MTLRGELRWPRKSATLSPISNGDDGNRVGNSDAQWQRTEGLVRGNSDNGLFVDGVLWVARMGKPQRAPLAWSIGPLDMSVYLNATRHSTSRTSKRYRRHPALFLILFFLFVASLRPSALQPTTEPQTDE